MRAKQHVLVFLMVGLLQGACSYTIQNETYRDLLIQTSDFLTNSKLFGNGSLSSFFTSAPFLQLSQSLNQANLLKTAIELFSNFTSIQQLLSNSSLQDLAGNIDLSTLPINQQQLSDAAAGFSNLDVSTECISRTVEVIIGLGSGQQWALRMLDASAKIPTELLNYNLDFYGSFDECVAIQQSVYDIQFRGQYCTAVMPVPTPMPIEGFPGLQIGMCVPDACSGEDIQKTLNWLLSMIPGETPFGLQSVTCQKNDLEFDTRAIVMLVVCGAFITVMTMATLFDITMVQWPKHKKSNTDLIPSSGGSKKVITGVKNEGFDKANDPDAAKDKTVVTLDSLNNEKVDLDKVHYPSLSDNFSKEPVEPEEKYKTQGEFKFAVVEQPIPEVIPYKPGMLGRLLLSFSVYTNGKKLLNTNQSSGSLTALNGIRFLSMSWVILGHTYVFGYANVRNVATYLPELYDRVSFQAIINALVSVDSFFTLSGLLLTYLIMKEMKRNKGKGKWPRFWFMFYFHRFWRLTPPYMLVLGVYVSLASYFYNGPKYPQETAFGDKEFCIENWWTNLLYINNFVNVDKPCFGWAWYLANDMQFYIISPLMLIPLFISPVFGVIVTCLVLLIVTVVTGVLSKINQWPPSTVGGGEQLPGDMFNEYYIKPYCRMGPYLVGMLTGYALYKTKCKVNINRYLNLFIWAVATTLACLVLYGLYRPLNGHPLNDDVSALYNATHRTVWGACVSWVVFACATGNGGFINTLLSWGAFVPLARLTYCAYLIHPILMFLYMYGMRVQAYWTDFTVIYLFLAQLVISYMGSFVVSLAFESPMMGMEKVIFGRK